GADSDKSAPDERAHHSFGVCGAETNYELFEI
ncbi:MAG: hypothetical protein JWP25_8843, partial [Bradyrhizobium sp.]|nr:hypothetical protein [Bradyrhizobium sp.]